MQQIGVGQRALDARARRAKLLHSSMDKPAARANPFQGFTAVHFVLVRFRSWLGLVLNVPLLQCSTRYSLLRQARGHDAQRGVFVGVGREWAPSVTNRFFTSHDWQYWLSTELFFLGAHARGADFMDDLPAGAMVFGTANSGFVTGLPPIRFNDLGEGFLHVGRLAGLRARPISN